MVKKKELWEPMKPGDFQISGFFLAGSKRSRGMAENKLCSFCVSKETCAKPKAERKLNCKDYTFKTEGEHEQKE
jgi:hypothetical protein